MLWVKIIDVKEKEKNAKILTLLKNVNFLKAAGQGAGSPVDYTLEILDDWRRNEVRTPEQADEYQVEYLTENGKCGLYGSGDHAEDYRRREEARERRRQENLRAGVG